MKIILLALLSFCYLASFSQTTDSSSEIIKQEIFAPIEQMPIFPGGEDSMFKFIRNNLIYPIEAKHDGIEGKVTVKFVIDQNGKVKDIQAFGRKNLGYGLEEAAKDVIRKMPDWIPGKLNGINVSTYFMIPIKFCAW